MGDNSITNKKDKDKVADQDIESKSSLKPLHPLKASEITILNDGSESEEKVQKIHEDMLHGEVVPLVGSEAKSVVGSEAKVETFFEKPLEPSLSENKKLVGKIETKLESEEFKTEQPAEDAKTSEEVPKEKLLTTTLEKKSRAASGMIQSERIIRNQSDIFSLKEQTSIASAIFSINGSPSRKVYRRKEVVASNVFPFGSVAKDDPPAEKIPVPPKENTRGKECYSDLKRPSNTLRNPLTGTGLSSNDEYKFKGSKRKDGNPLLGLGYSPEATPSTHRIPPGGFSHKLW